MTLPNNGLFDFLSKLDVQETVDQVWELTHSYLASLGMDHISYATADFPQAEEIGFLRHSYPEGLFEEFVKGGWEEDYTGVHVIEKLTPLVSGVDYIKENEDLITPWVETFHHELATVGGRNFFGVPIRSNGGKTKGCFAFVSRLKRTEFEKLLSQNVGNIQLALQASHCKIQELQKIERIEKVHLTSREKEVLQWLAMGKLSKEIADILRIRKVTVDLHIKNAKIKLRAATREHAVAQALLLGIVRP